MPPTDHRDRLLRRLAWACAALVLAITSLSAFIRLSRAGVGCEPWPQCHAQRAQQRDTAEPAARVPVSLVVARLAHRLAAVAALVVILVMAMTAFAARPVMASVGRQSLVLLGLALFLAVLGRWSAEPRVPAVTLGNLLAGFLMFAIACRLALHTRAVGAPPPARSAAAGVAVGLLLVQVALGGMVSAGYAGPSCPELPGCDTSRGTWQAFDPWHAARPDPAQPHHPEGALLHVAHRIGAVVVAGALLALAAAARRAGRRGGGTLAALVLLQLGLGATLVEAGQPLAAALAHNVVAALLLAATFVLAGPRPDRRAVARFADGRGRAS